MSRKLYAVLLILVIATLSIGCSQQASVVEPAEEPVALEPEEAISVSESGEASKGEDESVDEAVNMFPAFELKNLAEETVTEAMFAEYDLTLVNIWGTTCAPCIREMPELEKLQNEYADKGLKVVGIIADGNYVAGKEIVDALLLTYEHIVPNEEFARGYLSQFQFVPTTLFVNKEGVIIGEPVVGASDYEGFEEMVKIHMGLE